MAFSPGPYNDGKNFFNLSSNKVQDSDGSPFDFGTIENPYIDDNIIYILCVPLERGIALNAFVDSFKLNFTKKIDKVKKKDSSRDKIKEYASDLSYDLTLNVPAYSKEEAKNNLAKIVELQKLLAPIRNYGDTIAPLGVSKNFPSNVPYFSVWFKNLITSGTFYPIYPYPNDVSEKDIINHGFICVIDDVKYTPDMDKGFFDGDSYLYPKNIKLTLKLNFKIQLDRDLRVQRFRNGLFPRDIPFFAFNSNGHYSSRDHGLFPFGAGSYSEMTENYNIKKSIAKFDELSGGLFFKTDDMNRIDSSPEGGYDRTRVFISMLPSMDRVDSIKNFSSPHTTRRRYVAFKGYIDSFDRNIKIQYSTNDDKTKILGASTVNLSMPSVVDELEFNISFSVPAFSLIEAKKNCAKIATLIRMCMKRSDFNSTSTSDEEARLRRMYSSGELKVYVPHMIEKDGTQSYSKTFEGMYKNSLSLFVKNFSVDIDVEKGFFEDPGGKIWPKNMKITLAFDTDSPANLISGYYLDNEVEPQQYIQLKEEREVDPSTFLFSGKTNSVKLR